MMATLRGMVGRCGLRAAGWDGTGYLAPGFPTGNACAGRTVIKRGRGQSRMLRFGSPAVTANTTEKLFFFSAHREEQGIK